MTFYSIHAGHGKQDSKSPGAYTDLLKESVANREVKDEVIKLLRAEGHTVYDDTVDYPSSASDCVNKQISNTNSHSNLSLAVGIHFNSGRKDLKGDGSIGGFEVIVCNNSGTKQEIGKRICSKMEEQGFKNRGVKTNSNLGFLKNTKAQAIIVEVCFVDDADDVKLYNKLGAKQVAKAIVEGILGKTISTATEEPQKPSEPASNEELYYRVVIGSFKNRNEAVTLQAKAKEAGFKDAFLTTYIKE